MVEEDEAMERNMTLIDHLDELRRRLLYSLAALLAGSLSGYYLTPRYMDLLIRPVGKLFFMEPAEAFLVRLKLALLAGFILSSPVLLYQVAAFCLPALTKNERKYLFIVFPFAVVFFIGGILTAAFLIVPFGMKFLLSFATSDMRPLISADRYFSFLIWTALASGLLFEMPLVFLFLGLFGLVRTATMNKWRNTAYLGLVVLAAVVTPSPDPLTCILVSIPLVLLYEISVLFVRMTEKKKEKENDETDHLGGGAFQQREDHPS